jgi:hypothetical protein
MSSSGQLMLGAGICFAITVLWVLLIPKLQKANPPLFGHRGSQRARRVTWIAGAIIASAFTLVFLVSGLVNLIR